MEVKAVRPKTILVAIVFAVAMAGLFGPGRPSSGQEQQRRKGTERAPGGCFICGNMPGMHTAMFEGADWFGTLAWDACPIKTYSEKHPNELKVVCQKIKADLKFTSFKDSCPSLAPYCEPEEKKPPEEECDTKKACEVIRAMLALIARYQVPTGFEPGSFARFMQEFNPLLQALSEALACRFNQGAPPNAATLKDLVGKIMRDRNYFRTLNDRSEFPQITACADRVLGETVRPSLVDACADYDRMQRIRQSLEQLAGVLGCPTAAAPTPKDECKELSNSLLDGLTTLFNELDQLKANNRFGSGEAYDQVTDGIKSALKELEDTAGQIEGTGGTGAQQYKDIQGRIGKLRELLDVWNRIKAASCLPPEIMQLLRRLATEKKAGSEHKATCTELCAATADWYVKISGLAAQRGTFFKACSLACF